MSREKNVPIWEKYCLSIEEASAYSGISQTALRERIAQGNDYDFILRNGTKVLINRKKFEKFLDRVDAI